MRRREKKFKISEFCRKQPVCFYNNDSSFAGSVTVHAQQIIMISIMQISVRLERDSRPALPRRILICMQTDSIQLLYKALLFSLLARFQSCIGYLQIY